MDEKLDELEKASKSERYSFNKEYFLNAITFRELLKNIPEDKKLKMIREYLKNK